MKEAKNSQNIYVGKKIRELRKQNKLTQISLGEKIGVKDNTISAYERGVIEVPHSKLLELAKVLGVKYTALLPLENDNEQRPLDEVIQEATYKLPADQKEFLEALVNKTLSLDEKERENFIENIRFAVEYFDKKK